MTIGFEVYNDAGALQIDSENRTTLFSDISDISGITDMGYYAIPNPFGDNYPFGFLKSSDRPTPGYLHWFQLNAGAFCMPGALSFQNNSGRIIRTSRNVSIESGFLDVRDSQGGLVWSAKSANLAPRIKGFIDLPANSNVDNQVISVTPGFNPWILLNSVPGNISDDGTVTGYSGLVMKWTGSQIQMKYVNKYQNNFANTFGKRGGLRIPYAVFSNH